MKKLLLIPIIFLMGCGRTDFSHIHVEPNTSFPVGTASLSDSSLFAFSDLQDVLHKNSNGVMVFSLTDKTTLINKNTISNIVDIRSQDYDFSFTLPSMPSLPPGLLEREIDLPSEGFTTLLYFNSGSENEILTELIFNRGKIDLTIESDKPFNNLYGYFKQITRNGKPLEFRVGIPVLLDDKCVIAPAKIKGNDNALELVLKGSVPMVSSFSGHVKITSDDVKSVEGFFGRKVINSVETKIELSEPGFQEFMASTKYMYFADPQFEINLYNGYDIPMLLDLAKMNIDGKSIGLKQGLGSSKFLVEPFKTTKIQINNKSTLSGSGLSDAITKDFNIVEIVVDAIANPTKVDVGNPNYVEPKINSIVMQNEVGVEYKVDVPFDLVLEGVKISQTTDLDLSELKGDRHNNFEEFAIAISGKNELPLDLKLQPYVTSDNTENGFRTYLFNEPIFISGTKSKLKPTDAGFVPFVFERENRIVRKVDQKSLDVLLDSKKLFLEFETSTVNAQNKEAVNIFSPSKVDLLISIGLKADIIL